MPKKIPQVGLQNPDTKLRRVLASLAAGPLGYWMTQDKVSRAEALDFVKKAKDLSSKKVRTKSEDAQLKDIFRKYPELSKPGALDDILNSPYHTSPEPEGNAFTGYGPQNLTYNKFTPEQQQGQSQLLKHYLGQIGQDAPGFDRIEKEARRGFKEDTIPSIMERFTSLGAQRSGVFAQQLGQAGAGLESQLGSLRSQYNMGNQSNILQGLQQGLSPQIENAFYPGSQGYLGDFLKLGAKAYLGS